MSDLVPTDDIERIVGAPRHRFHHIARLDPTTGTVYILHSQRCRDSGIDLRECVWSEALDRGIVDSDVWPPYPVVVVTWEGTLLPLRKPAPGATLGGAS